MLRKYYYHSWVCEDPDQDVGPSKASRDDLEEEEIYISNVSLESPGKRRKLCQVRSAQTRPAPGTPSGSSSNHSGVCKIPQSKDKPFLDKSITRRRKKKVREQIVANQCTVVHHTSQTLKRYRISVQFYTVEQQVFGFICTIFNKFVSFLHLNLRQLYQMKKFRYAYYLETFTAPLYIYLGLFCKNI